MAYQKLNGKKFAVMGMSIYKEFQNILNYTGLNQKKLVESK